jgi:hypothetical protein
MKASMTLILLCWACLLALPACAASADAPPRPNILIIFTDDQGYADLGCFGSTTHKTPRMDELAAQGTRYTSFYAQGAKGVGAKGVGYH